MKGFITLPLAGYVALGMGAVILAMGIGLKVQSARLEACQSKYETFVAQVKANGEAAEKAAKKKEAEDKQRKEKADAENQKLRIANAALNKRLRNERAASRYVPPAPSGSPSPERACFSRADLERTIQQLDERVSQLIAEGDQGITDLNTAKKWAE